MKKRIVSISLLLTLFTTDAKISPEEYYEYMIAHSVIDGAMEPKFQAFSAHTDLIRGFVLMTSEILKNYRFYGWGNFPRSPDLQPNQNPADSCSYLDNSRDPIMDLIIQLFPSTGTELNAAGAGSFSDMISRLISPTAPNREDQLNTIIASQISDFFKIAHEIRNADNPMEHKIFTLQPSEENDAELVRKYFSKSSYGSRVFKGENLTAALARAARDIAKAVILEISTNGKQKQAIVTKKQANQEKITSFEQNKITCEAEFNAAVKKRDALPLDSEERNQAADNVKAKRKAIQAINKSIQAEQEIKENLQKEEQILQDVSFSGKLQFPDFFVNDLISAYAWEVLSPDKLGMLASSLKASGVLDDSVPYTSVLAQQFYENESNHYSPFCVGGGIGRSSANYVEDGKTYRYADCAETAVREFLSVLLCTGHGRETNLAIDRVPAGSLIRRFLTLPDGRLRTIQEFATDTSQKTRDAFAAVVNGHKSQGIMYVDNMHTETSNGFQLASDLGNFAKLICRLLEGYSGVPKVEQRIKEVNEAAQTGTFENTVENVTAIFTDLVKIRTDTQINVSFNLHKSDRNTIEGNISLTFPNPIDEEGAHDLSELVLHAGNSHASCGLVYQSSAERNDNPFFDPWNKKLYDTEIEYDYGFGKPLSILNYYSGLSSNYGFRSLFNEELFQSKNEAIALSRLFTSSHPLDLASFVNDYSFKLSGLTLNLIEQVFQNTFNITDNQNDELRKENLIFSILFLRKNKPDFDIKAAQAKFKSVTANYNPMRRAVIEHFLFGPVVNEELFKQASADPAQFLDAIDKEIYQERFSHKRHMNAAPAPMPIEILTKVIAPYMEKVLQDPTTTHEAWSKFVRALNMFDLDQLDPTAEKFIKSVATLGINRYKPFFVELDPYLWRPSSKNVEILFPLLHFSDYEEVPLSKIFGSDYKTRSTRVPSSVLPAFLLIIPEDEIQSAFEITDFSSGPLMMRDFLIISGDNCLSNKGNIARKISEIFGDKAIAVTPEDIINFSPKTFYGGFGQFYNELQRQPGELKIYFSNPDNHRAIFSKIDQLQSDEEKNLVMRYFLSVIDGNYAARADFVSDQNCLEFLKNLCFRIIDVSKKLKVDLPLMHFEVAAFTNTAEDLQKIIDATYPLGDDFFWNRLFSNCGEHANTKEELDALLALTDKYFEGKYKGEMLLDAFVQSDIAKFKMVIENYHKLFEGEDILTSYRISNLVGHPRKGENVQILLEIDAKYFGGRFKEVIEKNI